MALQTSHWTLVFFVYFFIAATLAFSVLLWRAASSLSGKAVPGWTDDDVTKYRTASAVMMTAAVSMGIGIAMYLKGEA